MNLKTISKPVALFTSLAFILLVFPAVALTVFDGREVSENETVNPISAPVETVQIAAVQENVISGDFDSVDWKSLIGQRLTITGDLVIVDTYDLARRGQVKAVSYTHLTLPTKA